MEKFLTIFKNTENLSLKLKSFSTASISFELLDTDEIFIGFEKFFRQFFVAFDVLNTTPVSISFEYWNGSTWTALKVLDETFDFSQDGFITFEPPSDWKASTIEGEENFYIRLASDASFSAGTKLLGISPLFSNDSDLINIRSDIVSKYNKGKSWVAKHEEAKKQIIQKFRNAGHRLINSRASNSTLFFGNASSIYFDNISEFDFLEPFELRQASKYLAMSLIYLNELTDQADDKFEKAGKHYLALANEAINVFMLKLDINDDGIEDNEETYGDSGVKLEWL